MNVLEQAMYIPDIENCKRILCIQPHPDDNEVGAGATIGKLSEIGCEVYYLTVTDGCLGTVDTSILPSKLAEIRKNEQEEAAKLLGVKEVLTLGFRDGTHAETHEIAEKIVKAIRKIKPQMIMAPDPWLPYEGHPDHRKTGMAAVEAMMFSGNPRFPYVDDETVYETWSIEAIAFYNTAYPNTFVDVTSYINKKLEAMACHKSQFFGETLEMYKLYFPAKACQLAEGRVFEMAEGFKVLSGLHLHCFVDAIHI